MLANKLLNQQIKDKNKKKKIIDFLCSESGSHDYTINRIEAKEELQLSIEKPNDELYTLIKKIFDDIQNELELNSDFNPNIQLSKSPNFSNRMAIIESINGGAHYFMSEGVILRTQTNLVVNKIFEGWRYESK